MSLILIQKTASQGATQTPIEGGKQQVLAQAGTRYEVIDKATGKAPAKLVVKRVGPDLRVEVDGEPVLDVQKFYGETSPSNPAYFDINQAVDPDAGEAAAAPPTVTITPATAPWDAIDDTFLLFPSALPAAESNMGGLLLAGLGVAALGAAAAAYKHHRDSKEDEAPVMPVAPTKPPEPSPAPKAPSAPNSFADNVGKVQSPNSTAPTTDDSTPGINIGTIPADTTPKLYVDGKETPATYDPKTGALTPDTPLTEGPHDVTYTVTDSAGKESQPSGPIVITVDITAPATPAAPGSYVDNVGKVQNPTSTAPATDDSTPGINIGTIPADTTPKLYVDGKEVPATYEPKTGTLTPDTPLTEGPHDITYTVTDLAGNESLPSGPIVITVDITAPATPAAPGSYVDNVGKVQNPTSTA
ncbi:Ig-like domain-containing protein, partial [Variovorax humicola]